MRIDDVHGYDHADIEFVNGVEVVHHKMASKKRRKKGINSTEIGLNLTSMIDIIFLLLIYFVVTASFTEGEGVVIAKLPEGTGQSSADKLPIDKVYIYVSDTGEAGYKIEVGLAGGRVSDSVVNFASLIRLLKSKTYDEKTGVGIYDRKHTPIVVQPTGAVKWQHVLNAYNAAVAAKFELVSFGRHQKKAM